MAPSWSTMAYLATAIALPMWWSRRNQRREAITGFNAFLKDTSVRPEGEGRDSASFSDFLKKKSKAVDESSGANDVADQAIEDDVDDGPRANVLVLYGTEFGFSREIAEKLAKSLKDAGEYRPKVHNMADCEEGLELDKQQVVLIPVSTQGDGVPPAEARAFCDWLQSEVAPRIDQTYFSVCALGDRTYTHFCRCGKNVDARLEELGGVRLVERVDVDKEDWGAVDGWISSVLHALSSIPLQKEAQSKEVEISSRKPKWGKSRPFPAKLISRQGICNVSTKSDKDTICVQFCIKGSGMKYEPGDALGVYPLNREKDVERLLSVMKADGHQIVQRPSWHYEELDQDGNPRNNGEGITLREALTKCYDIREPRGSLLSAIMKQLSVNPKNGHAYQFEQIEELLADGINKNPKIEKYLAQRHVMDILDDFSGAKLPVDMLLDNLRQLQPRLYSISSSQLENEDQVSLTVAVVRYEALGQERVGVCSTFLADRIFESSTLPVFVSKNPDFRLPKDSCTPTIMIGPGTGVAPFRAFIMERVLRERYFGEVHGPAMLFFGCRHEKQDFLYGNLLRSWHEEGTLKLVTAFSRMQAGKIYVQTRLREQDHSENLWEFVSQGGHIYVCGDANHMAGEVEQALLEIFAKKVQKSDSFPQDSAEKRSVAFLQMLSQTNRYQRDVWFS